MSDLFEHRFRFWQHSYRIRDDGSLIHSAACSCWKAKR